MNPNAARFWTWEIHELKAYLGIGQGQVSHYHKGKDFSPNILAQVQPKQLVETETHDGVIPVKMDGAGYHEMARSVMGMLGGIPRRIICQAEDHIQQLRPELVSTYHTYIRMKALPYVTNQMIAEAVGLEYDTALWKRLIAFVGAVDQYLDAVAKGWPEGCDVYTQLQSGVEAG